MKKSSEKRQTEDMLSVSVLKKELRAKRAKVVERPEKLMETENSKKSMISTIVAPTCGNG